MHPALRLVRAGNLGVSFVGTLVGGLVARGEGISVPLGLWVLLLLAGVSTALVTAGGNVLNDLLDLEGDRVNHPDRPLVTGEISVRAARILAAASFVLGAAVVIPVALVEPLVAVILVVAVVLLLSYEFQFKQAGFVGNLVVAFLTGVVFLYGAAAAGNALVLVPFGAMAFLATLSREVIKDMEDVAGDLGRRTLPQRYGLGRASMVARAAVVGGVVLSAVPFLWFVTLLSGVGIIYVVLVGAADVIFGVSIWHLPDRLHYEQTMSKVAMTVALFAFLAVAFR
ncbi:MAG TPA: geranylgeranylglycerol-phosphate geranylgeranyltransferase [Thermoplasmata archaeon]|nr:geranylgeranylglycerol-phosphate geranylgeranyltransferase [Thermoplasmata archaeon]